MWSRTFWGTGMTTITDDHDIEGFRREVREWCARNVPERWRESQTGVPGSEFVAFQKAWFQQLRSAGYAVPHWPKEWGGGMPVARQAVLYQELAAHDAPRLVLPFMSIHHAAATLFTSGTEAQRARHLPAILEGDIWCQGFSEPDAGSDLASLRTSARREGDAYVVNGQKLWASGAKYADWCLLLVRTDPSAPKRRGISYFLMDMRTPGVSVRPIRNANGDSHFCEIFLDNVIIPESDRVGEENAGWQIAQETLSAERGMTMLELAERLGHAGFRWLREACARPGPAGAAPLDDPIVQDRMAALEAEIAGLRRMCRTLVDDHESGTLGPADASIVKVYYSELLQRLTDFAVETLGLAAHTQLEKPMSSGWESGAWMLDFIGSWEWTIPGGTNEVQRNIIGERGLGLPREPAPS